MLNNIYQVKKGTPLLQLVVIIVENLIILHLMTFAKLIVSNIISRLLKLLNKWCGRKGKLQLQELARTILNENSISKYFWMKHLTPLAIF